MYNSIYDLKEFYKSASGHMVGKILCRHIRNWWSDARDLRIIGIGYSQPYLEAFIDIAGRCYAVMPAGLGVHPWPEGKKNLAVQADEAELPFETNSIDRILLIHSFENAEILRANLKEIWRVLKSNGRLLIITPNRVGFWARAEWSPFGQGVPYSLNQLREILRENAFVYERNKPVLFVPPWRRRTIIGAAETFEKIGPYMMPGMAGLHMIEASKQLYAIDPPGGSRIKIRERQLIPSPVQVNHGIRRIGE